VLNSAPVLPEDIKSYRKIRCNEGQVSSIEIYNNEKDEPFGNDIDLKGNSGESLKYYYMVSTNELSANDLIELKASIKECTDFSLSELEQNSGYVWKEATIVYFDWLKRNGFKAEIEVNQ
jgi:hypothetical protein